MNKLKAYFEANRPRTAREKYLFVQMCIKHVYAPLGVKMTSPDYKWGFLNSLTWSAIVMLYICATYTIVYFWYRDDHMQSLQTLCLLAVLTPVSFHPQLSLTHHLIEIHCLRVPSSFGPSPREVVWKHFRRWYSLAITTSTSMVVLRCNSWFSTNVQTNCWAAV